MPVPSNIAKGMLDWVLGGAAATRPTARFIQFATGSPNINGASDGPWSPRNTVTFAAANSPQMSATNLNALTLQTATAVATAIGWNLYDAAVGGNRLAYGTTTAAIGCKSGVDNISIAAGLLKITLS